MGEGQPGAIRGGFGVDEGVLMSKEPGFLEEKGEVLFEVGQRFKEKVVKDFFFFFYN